MAGKMDEFKGREIGEPGAPINNDRLRREGQPNREVRKVAKAVEKVAKRISNTVKHAPH